MSLGTNIRTQVMALIDNPNLRSTLTRRPITRSAGSDGGYTLTTHTEGSGVSMYCIPSGYVKNKSLLEKMGDVQAGEIRFLINYDETIDTDDLVTFDSENFFIREIRKIAFNDIIVAQSITLTKVQ